ncbi:uncharacterized protein EV154DRAFT_504512 [Mucor mucedo]|uniref:uncharacterized protein n=1 Tax=Mucor mucedo TaxID=29922 RepID=UPI002220D93F|nr:uncharacterized protein EV154DRAFT_504512 [Mucor mucedo]KAI7892457.1 hypothetical protein EV154DRAFT_504512 [Mucor mucedo]
MSCHSCGGCFTGSGCSTVKLSKKEMLSDSARFQSLLDLASSSPSIESTQHDHVIPTIMSQLSKNVYSSQTVLFKAYDELDLQEFLKLSQALYRNHILGVHIAWAAEYCQMNMKELQNALQLPDPLLLQHCDDQAEIHEMFGQLTTGSVGRVQQQQ